MIEINLMIAAWLGLAVGSAITFVLCWQRWHD